jgi:hypothetical protein
MGALGGHLLTRFRTSRLGQMLHESAAVEWWHPLANRSRRLEEPTGRW